MGAISVKLPHKSTAILPNAAAVDSGYPTEMTPEQFLAWVDERKKAKGYRSDRKVEQLIGHPDAIRNARRGRSMPKNSILQALVKVLGDPPEELSEPAQQPRAAAVATVEELEQELARLEGEAERLRITISVLKSRQKAG